MPQHGVRLMFRDSYIRQTRVLQDERHVLGQLNQIDLGDHRARRTKKRPVRCDVEHEARLANA